jgi:hypothetical protein
MKVSKNGKFETYYYNVGPKCLVGGVPVLAGVPINFGIVLV